MKSYKNKALNPEEMRRRREEEGIQLRKQKREQQVSPTWGSPHTAQTAAIFKNLCIKVYLQSFVLF